ncbi:hypothetical protein R2F61_06235 [Mollicutes bacterium LVI A0078]|nr:hypothetical protein RZE84_06240 [Mollicutes bacterium LVI A0075]WOO90328.1 hypothetical protein R2F61_06235 [Mollicutes bacterium LVI A0078]
MKKFIILIASAFSFCLFTVLLVFAFVTNDYGINIDESGLFPKFDFTFFDNDTDQTFDNRMWADLPTGTKSIKIKNNTKEALELSSSIDYYQKIDGSFSINVNTFGPISVTKAGATFNINSVPYTDFDYTYVDYDLYSNYDTNYVNVSGHEYFDSENAENLPQYQNETNDYTIKAGETYEIKLP